MPSIVAMCVPPPEELVAGVEGEIGVAVAAERAVHGTVARGRVQVGVEEEAADMGGLPGPVPLVGNAGVGREVRGGAGPQRGAGRAEEGRAVGVVAAGLDVEAAIIPRVDRSTHRVADEPAGEQRLGRRGGCERRRGERVDPGEGGVVRVLHSRPVVHGQPEAQVDRAEVEQLGQAQVGVVEGEGVGHAVIRALHEGARVIGDAPGKEEADLVERRVVVAGEVRGGGVGLGGVRVGEGTQDHHRERDLG